MANTNAPFGLMPYSHQASGTPGRGSEYRIASAQSGSIFTGDPVKSSGTGKGILVAAAGDIMLGVFNGCQYVDTDGSIIYSQFWPTGKTVLSGSEVIAWVYDDPWMLFTVQASGALAAADLGALADVTMGTAGSTATGRSGAQLDSTTIAVGGSEGLKIIDIVRSPDNAIGTNAKLVVQINEHELKAKVAGV